MGSSPIGILRREIGGSFLKLDDFAYGFCSQLLGTDPGFFIEAGAHDGYTQSNTVRLERELGWRGLLVESSAQYDKLVSSRSGENLFFRAALVEDKAITEIQGLFHGSLAGTADPELIEFFTKSASSIRVRERARRIYRQARRRVRGQNLQNPDKKLVSVPALTLSEIVRRSAPSRIDFFSLDVEGMEMQALRGFDFHVRPRSILVETRARDALEMALLLGGQGYIMARVFGTREDNDFSQPGLAFLNLLWVLAEDARAIDAAGSL